MDCFNQLPVPSMPRYALSENSNYESITVIKSDVCLYNINSSLLSLFNLLCPKLTSTFATPQNFGKAWNLVMTLDKIRKIFRVSHQSVHALWSSFSSWGLHQYNCLFGNGMPEHIFIQIRKLGSLISGPFVDQMGLNNKGKGRVSTLVHKSFECLCSDRKGNNWGIGPTRAINSKS